MIRVILPAQLCTLANVNREVTLEVEKLSSISDILDALEDQLPMLRGTIRDQVSKQRRPFIRFFACGEDLSQDPPTNQLPEEVTRGEQPLRIVGAMAGG
jgi:molybdopterin synthase sulfur carrier subunit